MNSESRMQQEAFLRNIQSIPRSSPGRPHSLSTTPACSMLPGVFLYKRPILWEARIAMEVFDGRHTKAKTRALILSLHLLPLWRHDAAAGSEDRTCSPPASTCRLLHQVEKPHPPGTKFVHNYTMKPSAITHSHLLHMYTLMHTSCTCTFIYS